jgi:hypothetical protein
MKKESKRDILVCTGTNIQKGGKEVSFLTKEKKEQMDLSCDSTAPSASGQLRVVACEGGIRDMGIARVPEAHSAVKKKKRKRSTTYLCLNGKRGPDAK